MIMYERTKKACKLKEKSTYDIKKIRLRYI